MKNTILELDDITVGLVYEVEYEKVLEADTPKGPIYRDKLVDIDILHVNVLDNDWEVLYSITNEELFMFISKNAIMEEL